MSWPRTIARKSRRRNAPTSAAAQTEQTRRRQAAKARYAHALREAGDDPVARAGAKADSHQRLSDARADHSQAKAAATVTYTRAAAAAAERDKAIAAAKDRGSNLDDATPRPAQEARMVT